MFTEEPLLIYGQPTVGDALSLYQSLCLETPFWETPTTYLVLNKARAGHRATAKVLGVDE